MECVGNRREIRLRMHTFPENATYLTALAEMVVQVSPVQRRLPRSNAVLIGKCVCNIITISLVFS